MIVVVDYRKGNLKSVERGLASAGGDVRVSDDPALIAQADAIVLPGVGAFADAAATMQALGQTDVVRGRIAAGVPFLGICLGMHLMFEEGVEGAPDEDDETSSHNACGLAILPGVVTPLPRTDPQGHSYKVPHVGWNTVEYRGGSEGSGGLHKASSARAENPSGVFVRAGLSERLEAAGPFAEQVAFASPLFAGIPSGTYFYFTHSYVAPDGPFATAHTTHSVTFPCAVQFGDVAFGVQFHPEKSSEAGARLLRNFVDIVKGA